MAALAVAGAAVVARAARDGRLWPLAGAGALLGLAFEVKLAEALLPVCAAVGLWVVAGPRERRPRALGLGLLGGAFLASALAWLVVVSVVPLHPRPWALGASDGSPWRAAFVYNGTERLLGGERGQHAGHGTRRADGRTAPDSARGAGAGSPRARARRRAGAPPGPARAAATAVRAGPPGELDRLRGGRRAGGARRRAGAGPLARPRPHRPRRPARARALAGRGHRAVQRDAGVAPALPGLRRSRRRRPAWARASRSRSARARGARRSSAPWRSARSSPFPSPRAVGAVRGRGPRCRGAPGRCRRRASPRCRTICARTRPAPPTRSRSARRPRRARSSPATRGRC